MAKAPVAVAARAAAQVVAALAVNVAAVAARPAAVPASGANSAKTEGEARSACHPLLVLFTAVYFDKDFYAILQKP